MGGGQRSVVGDQSLSKRVFHDERLSLNNPHSTHWLLAPALAPCKQMNNGVKVNPTKARLSFRRMSGAGGEPPKGNALKNRLQLMIASGRNRSQQRYMMKSSAQLERRRFERAPITAQVEYELTNSSSGPSRVRRSMANISTGGLFINTEEPIRAGTRMVVRFELPNKHRVIAVSRVVYVKKGTGLGVEFLSLDDEDLDEINAYIATLKPREETRV